MCAECVDGKFGMDLVFEFIWNEKNMESIQRRSVRYNTKRQGTPRQSDCMKNLVKQIVCITEMEWMCVFVLCNKCIFGFIINCVIYRANSKNCCRHIYSFCCVRWRCSPSPVPLIRLCAFEKWMNYFVFHLDKECRHQPQCRRERLCQTTEDTYEVQCKWKRKPKRFGMTSAAINPTTDARDI